MTAPRIETEYTITFDGSSFTFTITYDNTYDAVTFTAYSYILSAVSGHDHYYVFGHAQGETTLLDWRKCTSPEAASRVALLTAITALISTEVTFESVHVTGELTFDNMSDNRVLYVDDSNPNVVTAGPALASDKVLGGSSSGPPEAKSVVGAEDEITVTHAAGSITIGIDSAYKDEVLGGISGTTDQIDVTPSAGSVAISISSNYATSIDHGGLQGLSDDDHQQYLRADGNRNLSGNLNPSGSGVKLGDTTPFAEVHADKVLTDEIEAPGGDLTVTGNLILGSGTMREMHRYYHALMFHQSNVPASTSGALGTLTSSGYPVFYCPPFKGYFWVYAIYIDPEYTSWTTTNPSTNTLTVSIKADGSELVSSGPLNKSDFEADGLGSNGRVVQKYLLDNEPFNAESIITVVFSTGADWDGTGLEMTVVLHLFYDNTLQV